MCIRDRVNTDKMFSSVKVGDKEYKLLGKVSDFTKDGWKLEALRNENATLVPGGKLEKDAYLTNTDGKKIGVIIRNMSDKLSLIHISNAGVSIVKKKGRHSKNLLNVLCVDGMSTST